MISGNGTLRAVAIILLGALLPAAGWASLAANTAITSTVTVTYTDAAANPQDAVTGSVTITINLVAAAPLVSVPADVDPATENETVSLVYQITATANGPDSYAFSSVDTPTNLDGDAAFTTPVVTLGATTTAAPVIAGATAITVPFDGNDGDNAVNGLAVGDTIVIDPSGAQEVAVIQAIDESSGAATNTVTLTLTAGVAANHAAGLVIGERADVTVEVTVSEVTANAAGTHSVVTTVTAQSAPSPAASQATSTEITVRRPVLSVSKFVRNVSNAAFNPAAPAITVNATDYYAAGVSGNPGDTMRYLIVIDNTLAGAGVAHNIVVSDPIPQFTSLVPGSVTLDGTGTGAFAPLDETIDDGDAAETDGNVLYVYAGAGGDDSAGAPGAGNGTGGTLQAGEISYVTFDVVID